MKLYSPSEVLRVGVDIVTQMRALAGYNRYANAIVFEAMAGLTAEQLDAPGIASKGSVRANMEHVLQAQTVWLSRLGVTVANADASTEALVEYVDGLDADGLARVCASRDTKGNSYEWPVWQILTHAVIHGTQHRAETGILLAQYDHSPGNIDFILYCQDVLDAKPERAQEG